PEIGEWIARLDHLLRATCLFGRAPYKLADLVSRDVVVDPVSTHSKQRGLAQSFEIPERLTRCVAVAVVAHDITRPCVARGRRDNRPLFRLRSPRRIR